MHKKSKMMIFAVTAILLIALTAVSVFAYLRLNLGPVKNTFGAATDPTPTVDETFDNVVKQNVTVDVGDPGYAVYVRAAIVVTWEDASGNILATPPVDSDVLDPDVVDPDYKIDLNTSAWFKKGEFYYYRTPIYSGNTLPLINRLTKLKDAPKDGYKLHVEIISQTIQALGSTDDGGTPAVTDAWGVSVDSSGKLTE